MHETDDEVNQQRRRFKAVVDGQTYTIVGSRSEAHMRAVTTLMNQQLNQLKQLAPSMTKEEAAILLAFNAISDQLEKTTQLDQLQKAQKTPTERSTD